MAGSRLVNRDGELCCCVPQLPCAVAVSGGDGADGSVIGRGLIGAYLPPTGSGLVSGEGTRRDDRRRIPKWRGAFGGAERRRATGRYGPSLITDQKVVGSSSAERLKTSPLRVAFWLAPIPNWFPRALLSRRGSTHPVRMAS